MKLATDIGGTFTDLVYLDEATGDYFLAKSLSTPPHFSQGIMDAIHKSGLDPGGVTGFVHGATVVINALTERKGAKTALVTTDGCRDVLEIGRANRPDIYNMRFRKQPPFVPRELRFEVVERTNYKGEVVTELDLATVDAVAQQIEAEGCEAVAVCLLHSYANPAHELRVAARLRELLPNVLVTASAEITREWREYERTSTAVLNAYVQPVAASYLRQLESSLKDEGIDAPLDIMKSNGGTSSLDFVVEQPIHLVESGPVGGVIGAAVLGQLIGEPNLITMDIGGTTAKCSLIENGDYKITTEYRIERDDRSAGYPIKAPVVDIVEIGAGGGSIAWIDAGGALKIGPRSAGASPGPASYGLGGTEPTVTDANLIAGRINPDYFLGGELKLDLEQARAAYQPIADALGVSIEEAAIGVIRLANANMNQRAQARVRATRVRPARVHADRVWRRRLDARGRAGERAADRQSHHSGRARALFRLRHVDVECHAGLPADRPDRLGGGVSGAGRLHLRRPGIASHRLLPCAPASIVARSSSCARSTCATTARSIPFGCDFRRVRSISPSSTTGSMPLMRRRIPTGSRPGSRSSTTTSPPWFRPRSRRWPNWSRDRARQS